MTHEAESCIPKELLELYNAYKQRLGEQIKEQILRVSYDGSRKIRMYQNRFLHMYSLAEILDLMS